MGCLQKIAWFNAVSFTRFLIFLWWIKGNGGSIFVCDLVGILFFRLSYICNYSLAIMFSWFSLCFDKGIKVLVYLELQQDISSNLWRFGYLIYFLIINRCTIGVKETTVTSNRDNNDALLTLHLPEKSLTLKFYFLTLKTMSSLSFGWETYNLSLFLLFILIGYLVG